MDKQEAQPGTEAKKTTRSLPSRILRIVKILFILYVAFVNFDSVFFVLYPVQVFLNILSVTIFEPAQAILDFIWHLWVSTVLVPLAGLDFSISWSSLPCILAAVLPCPIVLVLLLMNGFFQLEKYGKPYTQLFHGPRGSTAFALVLYSTVSISLVSFCLLYTGNYTWQAYRQAYAAASRNPGTWAWLGFVYLTCAVSTWLIIDFVRAKALPSLTDAVTCFDSYFAQTKSKDTKGIPASTASTTPERNTWLSMLIFYVAKADMFILKLITPYEKPGTERRKHLDRALRASWSGGQSYRETLGLSKETVTGLRNKWWMP